MTSADEILRAKAEAVRALADALGSAVRTGRIGGPESAADFAMDWAAAVESMLPAIADVAIWRDRAGDLWVRNSGGGWRVAEDSDDPSVSLMLLAEVADRWGPLTAA
jgi:hypothetical protein